MNKLKLRINKIFNYIYYEKFYQKHHFDWGKYPNRSQLIQDIIDFKKYKSYLEIGCDLEYYNKNRTPLRAINHNFVRIMSGMGGISYST